MDSAEPQWRQLGKDVLMPGKSGRTKLLGVGPGNSWMFFGSNLLTPSSWHTNRSSHSSLKTLHPNLHVYERTPSFNHLVHGVMLSHHTWAIGKQLTIHIPTVHSFIKKYLPHNTCVKREQVLHIIRVKWHKKTAHTSHCHTGKSPTLSNQKNKHKLHAHIYGIPFTNLLHSHSKLVSLKEQHKHILVHRVALHKGMCTVSSSNKREQHVMDRTQQKCTVICPSGYWG